MSKKIVVIGGGAAGFFAAINIAEKHPDYAIIILEKGNKVLSKVKVSGGGRCNVTNGRNQPGELVKFYPRGEKKLYKVFKSFTTSDMIEWLNQRGVQTKIEEDLRVFPTSDSSDTIIECFLNSCSRLGIKIEKNNGVKNITHLNTGWEITTNHSTYIADNVILATGSSNFVWDKLKALNLDIASPVPSLFTFNIKDDRLNGLMGISFDEVEVRITGSKLTETGPLLITHWGLSGPAIIKLSAWGAVLLEKLNYKFNILVNFVSETPEKFRNQVMQYKEDHSARKVWNYPPELVPRRYWENLLNHIGIPQDQKYGDLGKKQLNKLVEELTQANFVVTGKSTFKEEFVTCGGVMLNEVDLQTMESKKFPGLFLAGEVLNIDGITGGFNFQACWSAGWIISENI